MKLEDAQRMAIAVLNKYGLTEQGWTFKFDKATSRLGCCFIDKKVISLSRIVTLYSTPEEVHQTLLHEAAHALLPAAVGHGTAWKDLARSMGYTGERTSPNPYYNYMQARGKLPSQKKNSKKHLTPSKPPKGAPVVGIGSKIKLTDGSIGIVFKKARTSWHIETPDGRKYRIRFEHAHHYLVDE